MRVYGGCVTKSVRAPLNHISWQYVGLQFPYGRARSADMPFEAVQNCLLLYHCAILTRDIVGIFNRNWTVFFCTAMVEKGVSEFRDPHPGGDLCTQPGAYLDDKPCTKATLIWRPRGLTDGQIGFMPGARHLRSFLASVVASLGESSPRESVSRFIYSRAKN